jgi:AraC-like DNA-binding protein
MMLSEGNLTVTEAAELCGFNDISYFSNVFKEMKGYPPSIAKKHAP